MSSGYFSPSFMGPPPPAGTCPGCGRPPGGERCVHCGIAARVGFYRVRRVLGERGAARTYLAADDTEGLVVLKELTFSLAPDAATLRAFHQEAHQLQALTHPRIPRYLDMLQFGHGVDMRLYLVQEFIEGTPLQAELARRPCTEPEARELARQILDLLHYLQRRTPPVFHGDLKPANLIRRPDGALFLVDFGAAWVRRGAGPETTRYQPPEQRAGELDLTTDLYALGVTLVDALSGEPSWRLQEVPPAELARRAPAAPGFRKFLVRLTAVQRGERFHSVAAAQRELDAPTRHRSLAWPVGLGTGAAVLLFSAGVWVGRVTRPAAEPLERRQLSTSGKRRSGAVGAASGLAAGSANRLLPEPLIREQWAPRHQARACEYARKGRASAPGTGAMSAPAAAIDHSAETAWRSDTSTGAWLQVDLGERRMLNAAVVDWGWDTPHGPWAEHALQTSLDGLQWQPLLKVRNEPKQNNVPRRLWFPPRVARYVRFMGANASGGGAHVNSLELYGPECELEPERASAD